MSKDDPDHSDSADDPGGAPDDSADVSDAGRGTVLTARQRQDDEEKVKLLRKAAQGDERAFKELIGKVRQRVYAYVSGKLRNHADVDEAIGETWVQMWKSASSFQGRSRFDTWVIGIAKNRVLMLLRSNKSRPVHDELDTIEETAVSESLDPTDVVHQKQLREHLKKCRDGLSDKHKECFSLLYYCGMSCEEAARIIGVPVGTIKTRMHHATQSVLRCVRRGFGLDGLATA